MDLASEKDYDLPLIAERLTLCVLWSDDRPIAQTWVPRGEALLSTLRRVKRTMRMPEPVDAVEPGVSVGVIICTRDRPSSLERCLARLKDQTRQPDKIIVVDSASTGSATMDVAAAAGVRCIRVEEPGLDIARNAGLLAATTDIVVFTDDDTEPHARWLERLVGPFADEHVMVATGLVLPARLDSEAQWVFEDRWGFGRGFESLEFGPAFYRETKAVGCPAWELGAGANMALRRSVLADVGLFDERLGAGAAGCSDDSEFWYRVLAHGGTCRYEPSAVVYHHHRRRDDELGEQLFQYMRGHVAALLVQYEKTGDRGNLRRLRRTIPLSYLIRIVKAGLGARHPADAFLGRELRGVVAGLVYYWRTRAQPAHP